MKTRQHALIGAGIAALLVLGAVVLGGRHEAPAAEAAPIAPAAPAAPNPTLAPVVTEAKAESTKSQAPKSQAPETPAPAHH